MVGKIRLEGDFNLWCNYHSEYAGLEIDKCSKGGLTLYTYDYNMCASVSLSKKDAIGLCKFLMDNYKGDI